MGEHTKFGTPATYSLLDPDAMIEAVRRMSRQGDDWHYELSLNHNDTVEMITWLRTAERTDWASIKHYGEWRSWFEDHEAFLYDQENARELTQIHGSHFKTMIVAIWTALVCEPERMPFDVVSIEWMQNFYITVLDTLNIELI